MTLLQMSNRRPAVEWLSDLQRAKASNMGDLCASSSRNIRLDAATAACASSRQRRSAVDGWTCAFPSSQAGAPFHMFRLKATMA